MTWRRQDVELGQTWLHPGGLLYKVTGIVDRPQVILKPADERDGDDPEYYEIDGTAFASFRKVMAVNDDGILTDLP